MSATRRTLTQQQEPPCQCDRLAFPHRRAWQCDANEDRALGSTNLDAADAEELRYIHGQDARATNGGLQ
ncbi:MAG TPA: hypothetical protein PKV98_04370 [Burkholderiaceae bacterium]|nr:hypothetical protein [Burkholderiaceae bacterium]